MIACSSGLECADVFDTSREAPLSGPIRKDDDCFNIGDLFTDAGPHTFGDDTECSRDSREKHGNDSDGNNNGRSVFFTVDDLLPGNNLGPCEEITDEAIPVYSMSGTSQGQLILIRIYACRG